MQLVRTVTMLPAAIVAVLLVGIVVLTADQMPDLMIADRRRGPSRTLAPGLRVDALGDAHHRVELCDGVALMHAHSADEQESLHQRVGPPLTLADAFISSYCGPAPEFLRRGMTKAESDSVQALMFVGCVTFVFNVKVFEFSRRGGKLVKLAGRERVLQQQHQREVYADLTRSSTRWRCAWDNGVTTSAVNMPKDMHAHSLVVQCPMPQHIRRDVTADGRLRALVDIEASSLVNRTIFALSRVPVCNSPIVQNTKSAPMIELGACTMVSELNRIFDTAKVTRQWVDWHVLNGVEHIMVYVDSQDQTTRQSLKSHAAGDRNGTAQFTLRDAIQDELSTHMERGIVKIVAFHLRGRGAFETQQLMETHCLWRYKGVAAWVIHNDIDEFFQPLGPYKTVATAVHELARAHPDRSAIQVSQSFWGHMRADGISTASIDVSNMTWRSGGPFKRGREKLVINVNQTQYISVHTVTTGPPMYRSDPTNELRMNHFRRHFNGLGAENEPPSWRDKGLGPRPIKDTSFRQLWSNLRKAKG